MNSGNVEISSIEAGTTPEQLFFWSCALKLLQEGSTSVQTVLVAGTLPTNVEPALRPGIRIVAVESCLDDPLGSVDERLTDELFDLILIPDPIFSSDVAVLYQRAYFHLKKGGRLLLNQSWRLVLAGLAPLRLVGNDPQQAEHDLEVQQRCEQGWHAVFSLATDAGFALTLRCAEVERWRRVASLSSLPLQDEGGESGDEESLVVEAVKQQRRCSFFVSRYPRRPRAMVFNSFFRTAGGGERSSLDLAKALDELGFDILLTSDHPLRITLRDIVSPFGMQAPAGWRLLELPSEKAVQEYIQDERIELFANHTYGSFLANVAPIGLYAVMFPHRNTPEMIRRLKTYNRFLCNSEFTTHYVHRYWGLDTPATTLLPPISRIHTEKPGVSFDEKEKLILNVGRFNVRGHNKGQLMVVKLFRELVEREVLDSSWSLVLAGRLNEGAENEEYVAACRKEAEGLNVRIALNIESEELCVLYRRAGYLWHFTGMDLDFGDQPERCEHLGLVVLDGFAYGTIPIVYQRSGSAFVIHFGKNGYVFSRKEEFADIMRNAAANFGGRFHLQQFHWSLQSANDLDFDHFRDALENMLRTL